jgi:uncharacterized repeat protein (TIGR01451 family)
MRTATGPNGAVVYFYASAYGGCDTPSVTLDPPSGSMFPWGTTTVRAIASDQCGNTNTCTFTVTVNPHVPISITCPSNITTTATGPNGAVVYFYASAYGGCDTPSVALNPPSGSVFPWGTNMVLATASDQCGNSNTCTFAVTVNPHVPVNITCPSNIVTTATGPNGALVYYNVTAYGGCNPPSVTLNPPSGSVFPFGTNTVLATAADGCVNSNNCTFTVTVNPHVPVSISCPSNIVTTATGPNGAYVYYSASASGGCNPPVVTLHPPSGSTFPFGTSTVMATAADGCGNSNTCTFTVTVNTTNPPSADLQVTEVASANAVRVGQPVFFTVTVQNRGPSNVTNPVVTTDCLPPGLQYVTDSTYGNPTNGIYSPGTCGWTLPNGLSAGQTFTLQITAQGAIPGLFTNIASVAVPLGTTDPNLANNSSSVALTVIPQTGLAVIKTVSPATADVGEFVQFYITLTNLGPASASNVVVQESLPSGLAQVSAANFYPASYYDAINGLWYVTNLAAGAAAELAVTAQVNASGQLTNLATVIGTQSASAVLNGLAPQPADLEMTVATSADCAPVGQAANSFLTVRHLGLVTASNIVVQEVLPGGLSIVASNVTPGTFYNPTNLQWSIPSLMPGEAITLGLAAMGASAGLRTNSAYLVTSSPPDSNPANNASSAAVQWSVDTTPPVLTCPGDITVGASGPAGAYVYYSVSAVDDCDRDPTISCSIPSGTLLPVGQYTAVCIATDASGNSNSCSFNIAVQPTMPIVLKSSVQGTNLMLQWTGNSPPYRLQMTTNLAHPAWVDVVKTITTNVALPLPGPSGFYRILLEATPPDPTDYNADRLALTEYYTNSPNGYWVTNGIPALARLAGMRQDLGDDPMPAFEGMEPGYSGIPFTNALQLGLLPPGFALLVNQQLAEGMTPWQALLNALRTNVLKLDQIIAQSGTNDPKVGPIYQTLSNVFQYAFNPSALQALTPPPQKNYHFPPQLTGCNFIDFFGTDAFSLVLPSNGPNDNNTNVLSTWDSVTQPPAGTTHNASCVAHAVGPSAAKLGIISSNVSAKAWNDLSKALKAKPGEGSASMADVAAWYNSHGYGATRAWNGVFGLSTESALEEAKAALGRGCDVLVCYISGGKSHLEMVTEIDILAGSRGYKGTVKTISWGQSAQFSFDNGSYSNKSDGRRYRKSDEPKSYLEGMGTAEFYYYCKK